MRTLLTALTCLMLFTTPVVAGDWEDEVRLLRDSSYNRILCTALK